MRDALSIRPAPPRVQAPQPLADRPLADRLALPTPRHGAVSVSFSGIFVKLSEVEPISTAFFRMALARWPWVDWAGLLLAMAGAIDCAA